jgi:hypothetical protein
VTQATVVQVNHPHAWGAGVGRHMHICFPTLSHDMCMCMHMVAWSVRTYGMRRVRKKLRCGGGCGAGCRGCRGCGGCGAGRLLGLYLELQLLLQLFTLLRSLLLCLQMLWCRCAGEWCKGCGGCEAGRLLGLYVELQLLLQLFTLLRPLLLCLQMWCRCAGEGCSTSAIQGLQR